jgi:hypothetical protein
MEKSSQPDDFEMCGEFQVNGWLGSVTVNAKGTEQYE